MDRNRKIVIIGGNACGMKTAARLRRRAPSADITVYEKGTFVSYGSCGFPYYASGAVKDYRSLIGGAGAIRDAAYFASVKGVRVITGHQVVAIDRKNKQLQVLDMQQGEKKKCPYDTLVIATGGIPARPEIDGLDRAAGIFTVTGMDEIMALRTYVETNEVKEVVITGGGFIGVEMAEALKEKGLAITLVKKSDKILPALFDEEMSLLIAKYLQERGVKILVGSDIARVVSDDSGKLKHVVTDRNETLPAGLLLITKGFVPNTELARKAGITCGESGAIEVNAHMQTSDPDIYAGGDCVECTHLVTGQKVTLTLGSLANLQGRVIADHIAGDEAVFPPVPATTIFKIFDHTACRTGITEKEARENGYDYVSVIVPGADKPAFYPGTRPIITKLIADRQTRKLLGAQILGPGDAAKRMEIVATAITCGATVDQLSTLNLAYSPPYSPPIDNIINAVNTVINKMNGLAEGVSPLTVKQKFDRGEDFIYLDVRSRAEYKRMRIDHSNVMLLPLGNLRKAGKQLPRDKEIIVSCMVSLRAYEGCLILKAMGFENVKFMDGGLLAWPYPL